MNKQSNQTNSKRTWKLMAATAMLVGAVMSVGCGAIGGGNTCEVLLNNFCERSAQCATPDTVTQDQLASACKRKFTPQTSCSYLSGTQQREMDQLSSTGCHTQFQACTCNTDGSIDCGITCNTAINNAMKSL